MSQWWHRQSCLCSSEHRAARTDRTRRSITRLFNLTSRQTKCHTMPSHFQPNSLKTNDGDPREVARFFEGSRTQTLVRLACAVAIFTFLFSIFCLPASAQTQSAPGLRDDLWNDLQEFVETPSVSGY